jgi:H+-transporting ATPase
LTVADPIGYGGLKSSTVIFQGALASRPETEDAIDIAIIEHLTEKQVEKRRHHEVLYFRPFDPVSKKAIARLRDDSGRVFHAEKGAPQVILNDALNRDEIEEQVEKDIDT